MKKLTGNINVGVFISGRGSNLKELIKYSKKNNTNWKIKLVISNKKVAKGLGYAKNNKIINYAIEKKKLQFEKKALSYLKKNKINLLCLAGFMRILSKDFIQKCKFKIINIHPSLLPKYKGLNTHERAIKAGDKYAGSTVHYVTAKLDSGKKILQTRIKILKRDTPNSLAKRVLKAEHLIYPKAVNIVCNKIN
jgi:phosphoribosylglycinamide formyltransferase 1